jgi:hypothetical protein
VRLDRSTDREARSRQATSHPSVIQAEGDDYGGNQMRTPLAPLRDLARRLALRHPPDIGPPPPRRQLVRQRDPLGCSVATDPAPRFPTDYKAPMRKAKEISEVDAQAAEAQILEQSKRIEFYLTEYSVELLAEKMRDGEFVVPGYQREFTWEDLRKSKFIESLVMGLPIPFLFFWEMEDGRLEIVDGSQRLRTIQDFILGDFRLGQLETLTHLTGFRFADLSESRRRKTGNRSIRGIVLNEHADEQARFDMFERINTGSKTANEAEVRRGALAGPYMDLVIELAQSQPFVDMAPASAKRTAEREREELVARFFAYGDGLDTYRDRPAQFIFEHTKRMNDQFAGDPGLEHSYRDRFATTMAFVDQYFPYGFRRTATSKATPRARFEAIAIGTWLALQETPGLVPPDVVEWLNGAEFKEVTGSDGANAVARLRQRMAFVEQHLLGHS